MAVTRTSTGALVSSAAALTATFGAGATAGDLGILIVESANQTVATPSGWTNVDGFGVGSAGAAGGTACWIFAKASITSGDISGGIAVADSGDHQNAVLLTFTGYDATTPYVDTFFASDITTATTPNINGSTGRSTTVTANDLALAIICTDRDSATVSTNSGATWSNIAGSNSFIVNVSSATAAGGGIIVNQLTPSGTQTAGATFNCTITGSAWAGVVLVIKAPGGTTVTPSTGHLILTGYLPTVTKAFNIAPSVGHLVLGGKVATVTKTFNIAPSTGHLVLTGHIPSIFVGTSVSPLTGHLTLTGHAPSVTLAVNVAPATGHLTLGGKVATVSKAFNLSPLTGHLSLGGKVPTVTLAVNLSPITGHLLLTGYAPIIDSGGAIIPTILPIKVTYRHRGRNC